MARKPRLAIVSNLPADAAPEAADTLTSNVALMAGQPSADAAPQAAEPDVCNVVAPAPIVPSPAELATLANASAEPEPDSYTLVIAGQYDSLIAAGMFATNYAKSLGARICVIDQNGVTVRCFDPPTRKTRGEKTLTGPRGADWGSKSGQAVKLMMRDGGATMDEMKEVTGWTFGDKYVRQLARSFGVVITTVAATARTKKTWHAKPADTVAHADDDATPDVDADTDHDVDAAAHLIAAE